MVHTIERERLLRCSFEIDDKLKALEERGVKFNSKQGSATVALSLRDHVPETFYWMSEPVKVDTNNCIVTQENELKKEWHGEATFTGILGRFALLHSGRVEQTEGVDDLPVVMYGVGLDFAPKFTHAKPSELVHSKEILVPLFSINSLSR